MLEHADGDPDEVLATLLPPRRHRHPARRRHQRGARRLPTGDVPGRAHRGPRAGAPGDEPPRRQRDDPSGRADGARARRRSRRPPGSRRASARSVRATAPTRPSGARCGCCCCTSPARGPAPATRRPTASRRSTRSARRRTSTRRRGRATRRAAGSHAPSAVTVHCGEGPHNVHDMEKDGDPQLILDKIASSMASLGHEQRADQPGRVLRDPRPRARVQPRAATGFSRDDVSLYLYDRARMPAATFRRHFEELAWTQWMKTVARRPSAAR